MRLPLSTPAALLVALAALLMAASASAQLPAPPASQRPAADAPREPLPGRTNQKIERITHEDAGNRIDELRVGGETQRITVQPKSGMPAYEVLPTPLSRTRPADHRDGLSSAGGQRVWNVLRF